MSLDCPKKMNTRDIILSIFLFLCFSPFLCTVFGDTKEDSGGQLKINRWALFNSTDEQIRIDTAAELLKNSDDQARKILIEALASTDNTAAQSSVCKAISKFRNLPQLISNRNDFIGPLMNIIKGQNAESAKLAAQASLVFSFKEVKSHLENIIKSSSLPAVAKRNAIYALQIRPDREIVPILIDLLDSDNKVVSSAAADALQEWLPIGKDKQQWQKIRRDIDRGRLDIVREKLLSQKDKIRQLNDEVTKWQKRYIASLDNIYQATADDNARAKFVAENLVFEHSLVRL